MLPKGNFVKSSLANKWEANYAVSWKGGDTYVLVIKLPLRAGHGVALEPHSGWEEGNRPLLQRALAELASDFLRGGRATPWLARIPPRANPVGRPPT